MAILRLILEKWLNVEAPIQFLHHWGPRKAAALRTPHMDSIAKTEQATYSPMFIYCNFQIDNKPWQLAKLGGCLTPVYHHI